MANGSPLSLSKLSQTIESGHVDTVLVVFTDMQGRLQGKRVHAKYFLEEVMRHGLEACAYLLAVDVDMNTVSGYETSSWDTGYGDFFLRPDMSTLRAAPWLPGTAMVQCDLEWLDGRPVRQSPRQVLRAQLQEAEALKRHGRGLFLVCSELRDSIEDAARRGRVPILDEVDDEVASC